jgi:hypothetical protein
MMRAWLDSWSGVGHVVGAIREQGCNARLMRSPFAWWAELCRDQVTTLIWWIGSAHDFVPAHPRATIVRSARAVRAASAASSRC